MLSGQVNQVPLALAFGAGLVASVNPCGFALLPSLLSYYLGSDTAGKRGVLRVADGLTVGLVLTAGFMVVFGAAGVLVALGVHSFVRAVPWLSVAMGFLMVTIGVGLLAGRHLTIAVPGLSASPGGPRYRSLFGFGIAYAVGSLSCTLPVFLLVVTAGLAAGSVGGTLTVFVAYAIGMAAILMLPCLGTASLRELVIRRVKLVYPHLNRISGTLLVLGGGYVAYYWISLLNGSAESPGVRFMQSLQRWAQDRVASVNTRVWLVIAIGLGVAALVTIAVKLFLSDEVPDDLADAEEPPDKEPEGVEVRGGSG